MKKIAALVIVGMALVGLTACDSNKDCPKMEKSAMITPMKGGGGGGGGGHASGGGGHASVGEGGAHVSEGSTSGGTHFFPFFAGHGSTQCKGN